MNVTGYAIAIAPIPLCILIRWGRALWLWATVGRWGGIEDRYLQEAVQWGHKRGYQDGIRELSEFVRNAHMDRLLNMDLDEFKRRQKEKANGQVG